MSFDPFKPFRRCFLCKGRKNLSRTVNPGYYDSFDYYHKECLEKVVADPEFYVKYVDTAIQITDRLAADKAAEEAKLRALEQSIQRVRALNETNILLDQINVELKKKSEVSKEVLVNKKSRYDLLKDAR